MYILHRKVEPGLHLDIPIAVDSSPLRVTWMSDKKRVWGGGASGVFFDPRPREATITKDVM